MIQEFIVVFVANFFAELGDKTQLAVLTLSSKYENHLAVFIGSIAGLSLATVLAVLGGGLISQFIEPALIKTVSGILFIAFGIHSFISKEEESEGLKTNSNPLITSFVLLFVMELGDKTQLANLALASNIDPILVFAGAFAALGIISAMAVFFSRIIAKRVEHDKIKLVSAAIFVLIGTMMLVF